MTAEVLQEVVSKGKTITLDVHEMPSWERHPRIFQIFDGLAAGKTFDLTDDHDPRPLHYQFIVERVGQFQWASRE